MSEVMQQTTGKVPQGLREAYLKAKYIVRRDGQEYRITPCEKSSLLDELLLQHAVSTAAFITPENPKSVTFTDEENKLRHQCFQQTIQSKGISYLTGYGGCDKGEHPSEESYLLFFDEQETFDQLSRDYEQNGYLLIQKERPVALMLLTDKGDYLSHSVPA